MTLENFTQGLLAQIDNPNCSYLVGGMVGQVIILREVALLFCLLIIYKFIDKLIVEQVINLIKKYFKRGWKKLHIKN